LSTESRQTRERIKLENKRPQVLWHLQAHSHTRRTLVCNPILSQDQVAGQAKQRRTELWNLSIAQYNELHRDVLRYCTANGVHTAEDLFHDALIAALKSYRGDGPLGGFIRTAVTWKAIRTQRRDKKVPSLTEIEPPDADPLDDPLDDLAQSYDKPTVDEPLDQSLLADIIRRLDNTVKNPLDTRSKEGVAILNTFVESVEADAGIGIDEYDNAPYRYRGSPGHQVRRKKYIPRGQILANLARVRNKSKWATAKNLTYLRHKTQEALTAYRA
jgi:DNA-directed RNA polymerase specialized sigma24 family protein